MSDLFWLTDKQMARLKPYFPKSHGKPWVDDHRVLSEIFASIAIGCVGVMLRKTMDHTGRSTVAGSGGVKGFFLRMMEDLAVPDLPGAKR